MNPAPVAARDLENEALELELLAASRQVAELLQDQAADSVAILVLE
jgi:hypothetical protein